MAVTFAATVVVTVTGCGAWGSWGGHLSADPALDANRANWVQDAIASAMSLSALTEQGVIQIVWDNGGGYVKRIMVSGPRGMYGQQLTIDTVLGTSPVHTTPPSGTVNSPDGQNPVECFTFTIGWQDAVAPPVRKDCPETALGSAPVLATAEAVRVYSAANLASVLAVPAAPLPATRHDVLSTLAAARAIVIKALSPSMGQKKASQEWNYATDHLSFASATGAAAALPVPGGGCVYLAFGPHSAPGGPVAAWPAPVAAPCTGAAALAAAGPVTSDPQGGGCPPSGVPPGQGPGARAQSLG
jgi:hypothetical protein